MFFQRYSVFSYGEAVRLTRFAKVVARKFDFFLENVGRTAPQTEQALASYSGLPQIRNSQNKKLDPRIGEDARRRVGEASGPYSTRLHRPRGPIRPG